MSGSTFTGNSTTSIIFGFGGGGLANIGGTSTVSGSTFTSNSATGPLGRGGGIANFGTATVRDSTFTGNSAGLSGGGLDNSGTLTVSDSMFTGNSAVNGGGLANESRGTATVTRQHLHRQLRRPSATAAASTTSGRRR